MKKLILLALGLVLMSAAPALALNCGGYPYTLTNGTLADANQVMANFNSIRTCANSFLAHNAANSDITSLTGLTTPLPVAEGGTGSTTGSAAGTALGLLSKSGGTMTGRLNTTASTTTQAGFNIAQGVAPTSPQTGDLWVSTTSLNVYANGASQRLVTAAGVLAPASTTAALQLPITVANGVLYWAFNTHTIALTILANANVAFPVGTKIEIITGCSSIGATLAAAGGVTLQWADSGGGGTGMRSLAACGDAIMTQVAVNNWVVTGAGLT